MGNISGEGMSSIAREIPYFTTVQDVPKWWEGLVATGPLLNVCLRMEALYMAETGSFDRSHYICGIDG